MFSGMRRLVLLFCLMGLLLIPGCATRRYHPVDPSWIGYSERGKASYYATKFQFRRTASGEHLNNFALTAAHKTVPFGTKVRVTNTGNGRQVTVRINDRGPFVRGRIIDLTRTAFSKIADLEQGVVDVKIEVVE